ncbi:MAG TPA: NAD(P)H-dependent glycerol-3-phosphate dehydrogenase [Gemmatimonadales bacterium]|nr:NAD(P)H-dependent glycerol-3-phosphate dehydrogenase [Gemmatimonadales bacterium]
MTAPGSDARRVAVIGAGAWGTTLADLLARKGLAVTIWALEPEVVQGINRDHQNAVFLPDAPLAPALRATGDLAEAVRQAEVVVCAAPSHAVRSVMAAVATAVSGAAAPLVVSVSKGLEPEAQERLSCVLARVFGHATPVAVLSGPSFAREVYDRQPTAVVAAAGDHDVARRVQALFSTGSFRVYSHTDVIGVELGGALKNVIALATGIAEGLGLGYNPRAALITRGLAELTRLGVTMGADPLTFAGLAGLGDLVLTATGALSRNRTLGVELGQGRRLEELLASRKTVAEGVTTARTAVALGERHGVELPIAREVSAILFAGKSPRQAIADLMERALKPEQWR